MTDISKERLQELMRYHKERAIYFEQMSDNMRHIETYKESLPHWDVYEALRELQRLREQVRVLEKELAGVRAGTHIIVSRPCVVCGGSGWIGRHESSQYGIYAWNEACPSCRGPFAPFAAQEQAP